MKKINVVVIEADQDQSKMYDLAYYPGNGLYYWDACGQLVFVSNGVANMIWIDHEIGAEQAIIDEPDAVDDPEVFTDIEEESPKSMISEDLFLKTIAIVSEPGLITDLVPDNDGE